MSSYDLVITPGQLSGTVASIASKSMAHRLIILAALTNGTTEIDCATTSADIEATIRCMRALGATITKTDLGYEVIGIPAHANDAPSEHIAHLDCGESGSTLRFLLPIAAAFGGNAHFVGHGRLAARPLSPLYEQLVDHGAALSAQGSFPLTVSGALRGGTYVLPGNVSSQYVSGLLMAAPLMEGPVRILVSEPVESAPYITLTVRALASFGVAVTKSHAVVDGVNYLQFDVCEDHLVSPGALPVEGDWSNAACWLAAGALSPWGIEVTGVDTASLQGDRAILAALALFGAHVSRTRATAATITGNLQGTDLDVSDIPDLVPPLAAVAASAHGTTRLYNAGRLRLKESDRLATVSAAINALGGNAQVQDDTLVIQGGPLQGGVIDAANDHRIAMMAAILASKAQAPVTVRDAGCVQKSYPAFWEDFASLGGVAHKTGA